mmetsp:Transcript_14178/g.23670  ORF Transcript_14178/g.23670 Transcript_14178/m.23670 type:complete len:212 (-) Transcript_14178:1154-1789(-)
MYPSAATFNLPASSFLRFSSNIFTLLSCRAWAFEILCHNFRFLLESINARIFFSFSSFFSFRFSRIFRAFCFCLGVSSFFFFGSTGLGSCGAGLSFFLGPVSSASVSVSSSSSVTIPSDGFLASGSESSSSSLSLSASDSFSSSLSGAARALNVGSMRLRISFSREGSYGRPSWSATRPSSNGLRCGGSSLPGPYWSTGSKCLAFRQSKIH